MDSTGLPTTVQLQRKLNYIQMSCLLCSCRRIGVCEFFRGPPFTSSPPPLLLDTRFLSLPCFSSPCSDICINDVVTPETTKCSCPAYRTLISPNNTACTGEQVWGLAIAVLFILLLFKIHFTCLLATI